MHRPVGNLARKPQFEHRHEISISLTQIREAILEYLNKHEDGGVPAGAIMTTSNGNTDAPITGATVSWTTAKLPSEQD